MIIREDDLLGPEIETLLNVHLQTMALHSPPESIHALDLDALRVPEINFWTAWEGSDLLGCGALKEIAPGHGEIKSMHTYEHHRGKGVGASLVRHIINTARNRNLRRLSLETGSMQAFSPAQELYKSVGFVLCEPFADYELDPNSIFMTLELET